MRKDNGVNYSMAKKSQTRRKKVIVSLKTQLASGYKRPRGANDLVLLTDHDKDRINNELGILSHRV